MAMVCVLGYDNGEGLSLWNLSPQSPSEEDRVQGNLLCCKVLLEGDFLPRRSGMGTKLPLVNK